MFEPAWIESLSLAVKRVPSNTGAVFPKKAKFCSLVGLSFSLWREAASYVEKRQQDLVSKVVLNSCFVFS